METVRMVTQLAEEKGLSSVPSHPNVASFATGVPGGPGFGPLGWWTLGWGSLRPRRARFLRTGVGGPPVEPSSARKTRDTAFYFYSCVDPLQSEILWRA